MTPVPTSWLDTQAELDQIHRDSGSLENTIDHLLALQHAAKVIPDDVLNHISNTRQINWDDQHTFSIQYNPHRRNRGSSNTPHTTPTHTIPFKGGMPCFLCLDNISVQWPSERGYSTTLQNQSITFLPNLYPIFDHHVTVITTEHQPQKMDIRFILELGHKLPNYRIVQNDEGVGATNPWHHHVQAFKSPVPIETWSSSKRITLPIGAAEWLDFPIPVLKLSIPHHNATAIQYLESVQTHFITASQSNRLNYISCPSTKSPDYTTLFVIPRSTASRTTLYKSGQPGYAEIAGMISAPTEEMANRSDDELKAFYLNLMSDIEINTSTKASFEKILNGA